MAERLTPPVRYPRYSEEPAENNVNRKSKRVSKRVPLHVHPFASQKYQNI